MWRVSTSIAPSCGRGRCRKHRHGLPRPAAWPQPCAGLAPGPHPFCRSRGVIRGSELEDPSYGRRRAADWHPSGLSNSGRPAGQGDGATQGTHLAHCLVPTAPLRHDPRRSTALPPDALSRSFILGCACARARYTSMQHSCASSSPIRGRDDPPRGASEPCGHLP